MTLAKQNKILGARQPNFDGFAIAEEATLALTDTAIFVSEENWKRTFARLHNVGARA